MENNESDENTNNIIDINKKKTDEFIIKAKKVHGDKYDYADVLYDNAKTKIKIKCNEHGIFEQTPDSHIRGAGCQKCGILDRACKSPNFKITNTCFSTVTVNYSWRTACHKDKGDFDNGFGNLVICNDYLNPNKYKGCYLGFPQYGVCVDVKQGDFLGMDVHEWHCNTEIIPVNNNLIPFDKFNQKDQENLWHLSRIAIVCYLRKNMIKCTN